MRIYLVLFAFLILLGVGFYCVLGPTDGGGSGRGTEPSPHPEPARATRGEEVETEPWTGEGPVPPVRESLRSIREVRIRGRFIDKFKKPVSGVGVNFENPEISLTVVSGKDGSFEAVGPGFRRETFAGWMEAGKSGYATHYQELVFPADRPMDLGVIVLVRGGTVSGCVVDREGLPVPGARVFYREDQEGLPNIQHTIWRHLGPPEPRLGETLTDKNGFFRMKGVPVGKFRIWAGADFMMYDCTLTLVEVFAGRETGGLRFKIRPVPTGDLVRGVVLCPAGEPVPGAEVLVYLRLSGRRDGGSLRKVHTLVTDEQGGFRFLRHRESRWYDLAFRDPEGRYNPFHVRKVKAGGNSRAFRFMETR